MPPTLTPLRAVGVIALGLAVGFVGTGIHRANQPVGLILALSIAASAGVLARAWTRWPGVVLLAAAVLAVLLVVNFVRPGGDVVIAAQPVGYAWFGSALVVLATLLLPRRWFSERPIGGTAGREDLAP